MNYKKFTYLFSPSESLLESNAINNLPDMEEKTHTDNVEDNNDVDSDVLSHSDMSWGSIHDRYVPFEASSTDSTTSTSSTTSTLSSDLSFSLLHQEPVTTHEDTIKCVTESSWSSYALNSNLWNDDNAPVVKIRHLEEVLFDDLELCGFFTDRLIGTGKSFLTRSPENGLYVLSKCIMKNMSLSNITMLYYHRYLQYIDLGFNYISSLSPLGGIPYLMYLNVAHNRMNTILNFTPPWYLTYVNLSYNYISEMCDISNFWSIVHLDLSHNAIETIFGLQNLKYLKYLNLSYNLIEYIENLDKLNIQELNLEGNCIISFKSIIPDQGIYILPHLRVIRLGYNKITTLEFFKDAYSLRVIDLKFNRINDLLELSNLKGLILEIDLRGNGCTKWPNYKSVILFSIPSIHTIDGNHVSTSEKIAAAILFVSPVELTAARTTTKLTLLEQLSTPRIDLHVKPYDETSLPLIILTGPCAVKKVSLALHIAQTFPNKIKYCRWYTTKQPENSDIENQAYIFTNREEFNDMSRRGEFLAIQEMLGNSYGFHHNQIISLTLQNKIGITQTDLHATIQMSKRYSNVKPILVLTKNEDVHRNWIQEKFDINTWVKSSKENSVSAKADKDKEENLLEPANSTLNFVEEILNNIIENLQLPSNILFTMPEYDSEMTEIILKSKSLLSKIGMIEMEEKKRIKFQEEQLDYIQTDFDNSTLNEKGLRVILDEQSNVIVEDEKLKRKRHQARLLHRRSTILQAMRSFTDLSESISSEEILTEPFPETKDPEFLKNIYIDLVLKTRNMYSNYHMDKPGFFSLVLLTDHYFKAFNTLINFIYDLYSNHSIDKSKFLSELDHFSTVAIPTMVDSVTDEIQQSLSTSVLQRKTLLRMYGVTSWKELLPSQMSATSIKSDN
uniref:leucine-rich repeat and guanylate kinase domain-containing protein-like n=1 Tax=Osmia lignaria TaxID=473952 RepID=UPI00147946ED|nr:leucine-rich repeat and guanylate kinase domain-containing protein-like [Osmia lignaria]